jgi:carboxylate-amine ligase
MTVDETITIAALFQAICARIYMLRSKNLNFIQYSELCLMKTNGGQAAMA